MIINESKVLFVNGESCQPFIFLAPLKCQNKNNEFHWVIMKSDDCILAYDNKTSKIEWFSSWLVLTDVSKDYGANRLFGTFKSKAEAMDLLVNFLKVNPDLDCSWLFNNNYGCSEINLPMRESLIKKQY